MQNYNGNCYYEYAKDFDNDGFVIDDTELFPPLPSESYSIWVYNDAPNDGTLLVRVDDFELEVVTDSDQYWEIYFTYSNGVETVIIEEPIQENYWEYIAFSRSLIPMNNNVIVSNYIYSELSTGEDNNDYTTNDIHVGENASGTDIYTLKLRNFAIYNCHKTINELIAMKYTTKSKYEEGLFMYFTFDAYTGTVIHDEYTWNTQTVLSDWNSLDMHYFPPYHKKSNFVGSISVDPGVLLLESADSELLNLYAPDLKVEGDFTFEVIMKISETRSTEVKLLRNEGVFDFGINTDDTFYISLIDTADTEHTFTSEYMITPNVFAQVALVKKQESLILYVDGEAEETLALVRGESDLF